MSHSGLTRLGRPPATSCLVVWGHAQPLLGAPSALLPAPLWTRGQRGELIFKLCGIRFTGPRVGKYLRRVGLAFQHPDKRAVEQDCSLPHTHRARNQALIAAETRRFFYRRRRQPHTVRGYFGGPLVCSSSLRTLRFSEQ